MSQEAECNMRLSYARKQLEYDMGLFSDEDWQNLTESKIKEVVSKSKYTAEINRLVNIIWPNSKTVN